jgi:predicted transcriptional regulator
MIAIMSEKRGRAVKAPPLSIRLNSAVQAELLGLLATGPKTEAELQALSKQPRATMYYSLMILEEKRLVGISRDSFPRK